MRYAALVMILGASICCAEDACPWMNTATAAGILGGNVTFSFAHASESNDDGACRFVHNSARLSVDVKAQAAPYRLQCGAHSTPLKAIGNEAVACSVEEKIGMTIEKVVGRVRDRVFVIGISITDHGTSRDTLREKARAAAEVVSGNLF